MTYAPDDLLAVRTYLLGATGLPADAVGIAGDRAHAADGGYHEGNDDLAAAGRLSTDYSKRESARDRPGSNAASALDIGDFTRGALSLRSLTLRFVAACQAGDPRTADVREVIYTPDGSTVRRFDRLGVRSTGDSSHLFHTHISFFRDSEGRRAAPGGVLDLFREIIEGPTGGHGMGQQLLVADSAGVVWLVDGLTRGKADPVGAGNGQAHQAGLLGNLGNGGQVARFGTPPGGMDVWGVDVGGRLAAIEGRIAAAEAADAARDAAVKAAIDALSAGGGSVDSAAVIGRMNEIAAAESAAVAGLHAELASARQEAAQLRERLAAAYAPPAS